MSEINRYRINAVEFVDGRGWVKPKNNNRIGAIDQSHKKGGWCKWSDVKTQLTEKDAEIERHKEAICIFVREKWGDMHIETDEEAIKTFFKYFNEEAFR